MLGKVTWFDKDAGMGCISDVEGKEWEFSADMIDPQDDVVSAKMKEGSVVHFEPNASLDNAAMRVTFAADDQADQFKDDMKAMTKASESKKVDQNKKLEESVLNEAEMKPEEIKSKASYELKPFIDSLFDYKGQDASPSDMIDLCDDSDALHEIADSDVPVYYKDIVGAYAENLDLLDYANQAIEDGIADTKDITKTLQAGIYAYNSEKLAEAAAWLKEYLEENFAEDEAND